MIRRALEKAELFFLSPADPRPLAGLRISLAAVLLAQAWAIRGQILEFFSNDGFIQGKLAEAFVTSGAPRLSLLMPLMSRLHVGEATFISFTCLLYVSLVLLLGLGLFTRVASVGCWFLHWTLMNTGESTCYGVDIYTHVFLFYLMLMPSGAAWSLDALRKGRAGASSGARLGLRVLQLHLCISYLCSAIEKGSGPQWWNGDLLWRALSLPVYRQFDMSWLANFPRLSQAAGISSLALEAGYCIFIWPRSTRRAWVVAMIGLHLGIAVFLGLHLFGILMALLTLSVFGISAEPSKVAQLNFKSEMKGKRMKLSYVAVSALALSILSAPGAKADGPPPTLKANMDQIGTIFKALKLATPDQNAQSAAQATQLAALFTAVLNQVPASISSLPAAQQPAALADFKSLIQNEIDLSNALAKDFQENHNADAAKALTDMGTTKTEGHGKYNP